MKVKEKRKLRGYKATDKVYKKAMKRASKEEIPLASLIEDILVMYADGGESYLFQLVNPRKNGDQKNSAS